MLPEDEAASLGLLYHLNSEPRRDPPGALPPGLPPFKEVFGPVPPLALPRPENDSLLMKCIRGRRSCLEFGTGALALADLAEIARGACGTAGGPHPTDTAAPLRRSAPSAGACYPLELYVAAGDLAGADAGLYHYNVLDHSLEVLRLGDLRRDLRRLFIDQPAVSAANAVLIFTAVFRRTLARYGARGYRYVLLEAGHAAQNACLVAESLGHGSLCLGGFFDAPLNRFLAIDGVNEAAVYGVAVGRTRG